MDTLKERLKKIRGEKTQLAFAAETDIPITTLGRYERGDNVPNLDFIVTLCVKYGIEPRWLLLGAGEMRMREPGVPEPSAVETSMEAPSGGECPRCPRLEVELEQERRERRELNAENRQLWRDNAELRERVARLEEQRRQCCTPSLATPQRVA